MGNFENRTLKKGSHYNELNFVVFWREKTGFHNYDITVIIC